MELRYLNSIQRSQLNGLFHTLTCLMNRVGARQNTVWLVSNVFFSLSGFINFLKLLVSKEFFGPK